MTASATAAPHFQRPTSMDRAANRLFGALVELGVGPSDARVLEVVGRRSGRTYRTPVNLMRHAGRSYLVSPRGHTAWARNALAAGEVTLLRGRDRRRYRVRPLPLTERPPILSAYLTRYALSVRRFFSVPVGAEPALFAPIAGEHPVFELHET